MIRERFNPSPGTSGLLFAGSGTGRTFM